MKMQMDVATTKNVIASMTDEAIARVSKLTDECLKLQQVDIRTDHLFHAGMYARTVIIPAGVVFTGVLIKIATLLIIHGDCIIYLDGAPKELKGYNVFAASAKRKQAFVAMTDTHLTMIFPTMSRAIKDAEREFTDETGLLLSRRQPNQNNLEMGE